MDFKIDDEDNYYEDTELTHDSIHIDESITKKQIIKGILNCQKLLKTNTFTYDKLKHKTKKDLIDILKSEIITINIVLGP